MPLISSPLYNFLYKQTVATFPGAFLLFNVALYIIVMFMSAWVYLAMKKAGVLSGDEMEVMETKKRLMITVQSDGNKLEKYLSTMK